MSDEINIEQGFFLPSKIRDSLALLARTPLPDHYLSAIEWLLTRDKERGAPKEPPEHLLAKGKANDVRAGRRNFINGWKAHAGYTEELERIADALVDEYLMNQGTDSEFIACHTPSESTIGTGGVWDLWCELRDVLRDQAPVKHPSSKLEEVSFIPPEPPSMPMTWKKVSDGMPDKNDPRRVLAFTRNEHPDMRYRLVSADLFKTVCTEATYWMYVDAPEGEAPGERG